MHRYAPLLVSFLSRFLFSDRVLAHSTPLHSVHLLAAVLAAGVVNACTAQATNIDETVTIPPPAHQDYNGHLNIGTGHDGTLNILQGGLVTVENDAVLGNSAGVTGTVNVTGPNATFSTVTDSTNFNSNLSGTVGRFGAGLTVGLSQSLYIYGEYDCATGDHIQEPWSVDAGLRWQW